MSTQPLKPVLLLAALLAPFFWFAAAGCQGKPNRAASPATNFSGTISSYLIGATVDPVGPTKWCYTVEGFSTQFTNAPGYGNTPYPGAPSGHISAGAFTNIEVDAAGCRATVSTPGWSVKAGSSFTFTSGTNRGTSQVQFCLECDKTNGTVKIVVTDNDGKTATIDPIAGPK